MAHQRCRSSIYLRTLNQIDSRRAVELSKNSHLSMIFQAGLEDSPNDDSVINYYVDGNMG